MNPLVHLKRRSVGSMISPRERYEREAFWELAEDIAATEIPTTSMYGQSNRKYGGVFRRFRKSETE
jgi:hypothetical protein